MSIKLNGSVKSVDTREWYDFIGQLSDTIPGIHLGGMDATRRLLEMCGIDGSERILDVGCGAGHTACLIAQQFGAQVDGIDASDVMLAKANERANRMGVSDRVEFHNADVFDLPFDDGIFDLILIESVLVPLLGEVADALHEMMRVLRPGGLVGANESTLDPRAPPEILDAFARHPAIYSIFTAQSLRDVFKGVGLEQIRLVETKNVEAPSPVKELGCGGLLSFMLRTYPKILLKLLRDARFREASRIDDQITKQAKGYTGYVLIVGRKPEVISIQRSKKNG